MHQVAEPTERTPINSATIGWLFFRVLRWIAWLWIIGFSLYFLQDRKPHLNSFGHLLPITELNMFGPILIGVFAGLFELMMRERANRPRPRVLRDWL